MKMIGKVSAARVSLVAFAALFLLAIGYIAYQIVVTSTFDQSYAASRSDDPNLESSPNSLKLTVDNLLKLTNDERSKKGLAPLKIDQRLNNSAQQVAQDMHDRDYFTHFDPVTNKPHTDIIWAHTGTDVCSYVSENISYTGDDGYSTANTAINWWMNSTKHREAILDQRYDTVGFGIDGKYVAQHFCDAK